ncbi:hypothetical protein BD779DRAFT_1671359 [Infundibulicybe gibba]|nr:hypothetical protein BD779DRAFT_1671359 [Infundibulicybe gibba]
MSDLFIPSSKSWDILSISDDCPPSPHPADFTILAELPAEAKKFSVPNSRPLPKRMKPPDNNYLMPFTSNLFPRKAYQINPPPQKRGPSLAQPPDSMLAPTPSSFDNQPPFRAVWRIGAHS